MSDQEPKKMMDFPREQWDAFTDGYFWGQRSIVNTMVQDVRKEIDATKLQLAEAKKALQGIYDDFMKTITDGGTGAVDYATAGRMKDMAAWGLRRIEDVRGEMGGR